MRDLGCDQTHCEYSHNQEERLLPPHRVIPLLRSIRTQQRLDCTAFVHCTVSLCYLVERQCEVEYFARIDVAVEHELDQVRQVPPHGSRTTVESNKCEE